MASDDKNNRIRKSVKKFARTLLATTCLTVASGGAALAGTVSYNDDTGSEFSNNSLAPSVLASAPGPSPMITTLIGGFCNSLTAGCGSVLESSDFIELTGLLGGAPFTLSATASAAFFPSFTATSDTPSTIIPTTAFSQASPFNGGGTAPSDGNLILAISGNEGNGTYTITVTQNTAAPEPSTLGGVGLALAGALAWRRKRSK